MTTGDFSATCNTCRGRFSWKGSMLDMPPCPHCGRIFPLHEKRDAQEQLERDAITAQVKKFSTRTSV